MKKGFTLIELLVVVLIIGILAAIAVPRYMKIITRVKTVNALISFKALSDAQKRYYTVNGVYTADLNLLDIQTKLQFPDYSTISLHEIPYNHLQAYNSKTESWVVAILDEGTIYCAAQNSSETGNQTCKDATSREESSVKEAGHNYYAYN